MNRVKSLSKSGNPRKDQTPNPVPQTNKEVSSTSSLPADAGAGAEGFNDQCQEKPMDTSRKFVEKENSLYSSAADIDKQHIFNGREEKVFGSASMDKERFEVKNSYSDSTSQRMNSYSQNDTDEKVPKVSLPHRKRSKDEKSERPANWMKRDSNGSDVLTTSSKQQNAGNYNTVSTGSRLYEAESSPDRNISAILEVCHSKHRSTVCLPVFS